MQKEKGVQWLTENSKTELESSERSVPGCPTFGDVNDTESKVKQISC